MSSISIEKNVAELRLLVGALGEREGLCWWPTSFFSNSAKMFLDPVFPRTLLLAQYHGMLEAARREHDEHLTVGSFHLFRLPEEVEQNINRFVSSMPSNEGEGVFFDDVEAGMAALLLRADGKTEAAEGPLHCGDVENILSGTQLSRVASIYHHAYAAGTRTYPYFEVFS